MSTEKKLKKYEKKYRQNMSEEEKQKKISNVNIDKIIIYEEFPCANKGSNYFVGYKNNEDVTSLCA